jgi:hypothetical protein
MPLQTADLGSANKQAVAKGVFLVIDSIQRTPRPVDRVAAVAATLLLVCREHHLDASRVLASVDQMLHDQERHTRAHFAAASQYVRKEL